MGSLACGWLKDCDSKSSKARPFEQSAKRSNPWLSGVQGTHHAPNLSTQCEKSPFLYLITDLLTKRVGAVPAAATLEPAWRKCKRVLSRPSRPRRCPFSMTRAKKQLSPSKRKTAERKCDTIDAAFPSRKPGRHEVGAGAGAGIMRATVWTLHIDQPTTRSHTLFRLRKRSGQTRRTRRG